MSKPFWETEQDLTDEEQERIKPDEREFDRETPEGSAASIESAMDVDFDDPLQNAIEDRAEAIQTIDNDPDIPDRFEDDVYTSRERAEAALTASMLRGIGAGNDSRGVDSVVRWGLARVDEFGGIVKEGQPDDAEFTQDNDLLPFGHPRRSLDDPPKGVDETPFVEGVPDEKKRDTLNMKLF